MGMNQVAMTNNDVDVKHVFLYLSLNTCADGCKAMRVSGIGCLVTC